MMLHHVGCEGTRPSCTSACQRPQEWWYVRAARGLGSRRGMYYPQPGKMNQARPGRVHAAWW
jgi:hypothetical protein